jgi:hypothetical protein
MEGELLRAFSLWPQAYLMSSKTPFNMGAMRWLAGLFSLLGGGSGDRRRVTAALTQQLDARHNATGGTASTDSTDGEAFVTPDQRDQEKQERAQPFAPRYKRLVRGKQRRRVK